MPSWFSVLWSIRDRLVGLADGSVLVVVATEDELGAA